MTTQLLGLPLSSAIPEAGKKKRVLLVDTSQHKRELRAEIMRRVGIEVDSAADIGEARIWWKADLYDLVLINVENDGGQRDRFCGDIRNATPPQQLMFLVGKPEYLANLPNADEPSSDTKSNGQVLVSDIKAALAADLGDIPQRWGILEASRRISAVRSACTARTKAMQDRPVPRRDPEGRLSRRTTAATTLDRLLREEMQ
jgi:CheY-like chemotaxis protein